MDRIEEISERLEEHDLDLRGWMNTVTPGDVRFLLSQLDAARKVVEPARNLLDHYVRGVNSGDGGNWDPETEPQVIELRAALDASRKGE